MGPAPSSRAASTCSAIERLQRRQKDEHSKRGPFPAYNQHDGKQRHAGEEFDGAEPQRTRDPREKAEHRVHQHVFPDQRTHRRHHKKGSDDQQPADIAAGKILIEQKGEERSKNEGDGEDQPYQEQGVAHRYPQRPMGQEIAIILPPGEAGFPWIQQVIALGGKPERHGQGHDHPQEERRDRWREQRPAVQVAGRSCCRISGHLTDLPSSACSASACANARAC